ncbi:hypothetical protein WMY93_030985 [Mugilogobius chulae]|uniref:Uncharacterized protein n=1 Tax=Mugilogobius chulae TaxID=88201 RepID=A0AAW0MPN4_9GOBI
MRGDRGKGSVPAVCGTSLQVLPRLMGLASPLPTLPLGTVPAVARRAETSAACSSGSAEEGGPLSVDGTDPLLVPSLDKERTLKPGLDVFVSPPLL